MAAKVKYSLEECLDRAAVYLFSTSDSELAKVSPDLVKTKHIVLIGHKDVPQRANYKAGWEIIGAYNTIIEADKLYGESEAAKFASGIGYGYNLLLDVMKTDAATMGLGKELRLHEIHDKVMENEDSVLRKLVTELAPYSEIKKCAKEGGYHGKGAAGRIQDFEVKATRAKRERGRNASMPVFAIPALLTGGIAPALTFPILQYSREGIARLIEGGRLGEEATELLGKGEAQLGKTGFSLPYFAVLGAEKAIGVPVNLYSVLVWTVGLQGLSTAFARGGHYKRKLKAIGRTLKNGWDKQKGFWKTADENRVTIEAEEELEKESGSKIVKYLKMLKFPLGKSRYCLDLEKWKVKKRLDEKDIIDTTLKEMAGDIYKKYPIDFLAEFRHAAAGKRPEEYEYVPPMKECIVNAKISEDVLDRERGAVGTVPATTIDRISEDARPFGGREYNLGNWYLKKGAENRAKWLRENGYKVEEAENNVLAFHKPENGAWAHFLPGRLMEELLVKNKDSKNEGSVPWFLNDITMPSGQVAQFPRIEDGGQKIVWDAQDYEILISDMLDKRDALLIFYHELEHIGDRLKAFETLIKLGMALSERSENGNEL